MFRFWIREVLGWLLVLAGLLIFCLAILMLLTPPRIFEAPAVVVIGVVVFRGGIHLLKVAVAARICMHTQAEVKADAASEKRLPKGDVPWDW